MIDWNSSSITVQWEAVDCIHRNGDITGYSVRYGVQGSVKRDRTVENVTGSSDDVTGTTISGLAPNTSYVIEVAAVNGNGTGPYSDPMYWTTSVEGQCMLHILYFICTHNNGLHSPSGAFIRFFHMDLPNHVYVNLSLVGNAADGSDSVQCHTDLDTCCNSDQGADRGDWYFPSGDVLFTSSSGDIYESHGAQRVDLHRRNNADMPSGIYRCDIETNAVNSDDNADTTTRETVYAGLYATGGKLTLLLQLLICD